MKKKKSFDMDKPTSKHNTVSKIEHGNNSKKQEMVKKNKKSFNMDKANIKYGAVSKIEHGSTSKVLINKQEMLELLDLNNIEVGTDIDISKYYTKLETNSLINDKIPKIDNPIDGRIAVITSNGEVAPADKSIDEIGSDSYNIEVDSSAFSKNLTTNEDTLQKALDRIDKFSFTDFKIGNWVPGQDYITGDIRIHNNTFVIATGNSNNSEFDPINEWETVTGIMQYETNDTLPDIGKIGILYVVVNDSTNDDKPKAYVWNSNTNGYAEISSNSQDSSDTKQVMVSPNDASEGYLEGKLAGDSYILVQKTVNDDNTEAIQLSLDDSIFKIDTNTSDDVLEGTVNKYYVKEEALNSVGNMFKSTNTIDLNYDSINKKIEAKAISNTSVQKIEIAKNGDLKATRKKINFVEGYGVNIDTAVDDLNDRIDITIKSGAEMNTASNIGKDGVGVFFNKDVYDLQFKKLSSENGKLLIEDDKVNNKIVFTVDDSKLSIDAMQINGLTEAITNDQSMVGLLKDRHVHENSTVLNRLNDEDGHLSYNGKYVGDMVMDAFDADKDGIVDKAMTLVNLTVTVDSLNFLQGASRNIQAQINALSRSLHYEGAVDSYADLISIENPTDGSLVVVLIDEKHFDGRSQFIYSESKSKWEYNGTFDSTSRDFTINPLKLNTEVSGILADSMIASSIARKTDIPQFINKTLLDNLSDVNGVLTYLGGPVYDNSMVIDDINILSTKTWSSYKLYKELGKVGNTIVDETNKNTNQFLIYDGLSNKLKYSEMFIPEWKQLKYYEKGSIVWANDSIKRCKIPHESGLLFNHDIDNWDDGGSGGGGGTSTLKTISGEITVAANDSAFVHLNTGYNKYDIRSIYAKSMISEDIAIEVYNQTNGGVLLYQSLENPIIQDIVNAPCEDSDSTKCIHVKFVNLGSMSTNINYLIYITSLL